MELGEILGYIASALVLATFTMRTIIPLRILGIASNIAFMAYGYVDDLLPVFVLHAILFPLNIYRLVEMRRLIANVKQASEDGTNLDWLLPFMDRVEMPAGAKLFCKGEQADHMYYLVSGRLKLVEFDVVLEPGSVVGEIGMFSPAGRRTGTVECVIACELMRISKAKVRELFFQSPQFGYYMIDIVTGRLVEDMQKLEARVGAPPPSPS